MPAQELADRLGISRSRVYAVLASADKPGHARQARPDASEPARRPGAADLRSVRELLGLCARTLRGCHPADPRWHDNRELLGGCQG